MWGLYLEAPIERKALTSEGASQILKIAHMAWSSNIPYIISFLSHQYQTHRTQIERRCERRKARTCIYDSCMNGILHRGREYVFGNKVDYRLFPSMCTSSRWCYRTHKPHRRFFNHSTLISRLGHSLVNARIANEFLETQNRIRSLEAQRKVRLEVFSKPADVKAEWQF